MPKPDTVEIKLLRLRETKGTVVYEGGEADPLRLLYLRKGSFTPMPDALRVTIEAVRPPVTGRAAPPSGGLVSPPSPPRCGSAGARKLSRMSGTEFASRVPGAR